MRILKYIIVKVLKEEVEEHRMGWALDFQQFHYNKTAQMSKCVARNQYIFDSIINHQSSIINHRYYHQFNTVFKRQKYYGKLDI